MTISICLSIIYMLTQVSMEFFLILRRVLTAGEVTGSALVAIPPMGSQLVVSDMLLTVGSPFWYLGSPFWYLGKRDEHE
jgi:hypothetical protein